MILAALLTGLGAGLGIALPLGPIALLLFSTGMSRGRRIAVAAATGVASVDLCYAAVAVAAGAAISQALAGRERPVGLVAGLVVAAVAGHGLRRTLRSARTSTGSRETPEPAVVGAFVRGGTPARGGPDGGALDHGGPDDALPEGGGPDDGGPDDGGAVAGEAAGRAGGRAAVRSGVWGAYGTFVVLTAVNPFTAVYFTALAAGLADRLHGAGARIAFASGIFLGSWSWQLVLALVGSVAGARLPRRATLITGVLGNGLALALALVLAVSALLS